VCPADQIFKELKADPDSAFTLFEELLYDSIESKYGEGNICVKEVLDILPWTYDFFSQHPDYQEFYGDEPLSCEEARVKALAALDTGDIEAAQSFLHRAGEKRPRGRPHVIKARSAAVKAFMFMTFCGWNIKQAADHFYPQNPKSLAATVRRLREQLNDYGITLLKSSAN